MGLKRVVADIETNGFLNELTTVHCLVLRDLDSDTLMSCADQPGYTSIRTGLEVLSAAERVYFHNGIKFDYPALRKVYPTWDMDRSRLKDTQVIAQMRWAHIKPLDYNRKGFPQQLAGSHALAAWGYRLGVLKGKPSSGDEEESFEKWTPELQGYCEQDTLVGKALVQHIQENVPPPEAIEIEHELAWYLAAQERNGWPFDMEKATALQALLAGKRENVRQQLVKTIPPRRKNAGKITPKKDNPAKGYVAGVPFQKTKMVEFNPGSRQDTVHYLKTVHGWNPTEFTDDGGVKLDETVLDGFGDGIPEVTAIKEYLVLVKRLGQLAEGKQAWLKHATKDGPEGGKLTGMFHIHGRVKQNHAITHRAAHASPNVAQVPKADDKTPYGPECRGLWTVPEGWDLIGSDASGLEARCLGHYMAQYDGGDYGKLLLEGDVHTANRIALGLPEGKFYRDGTKNWFYAFMYGAGDFKLGFMLNLMLKKVLTTGQLKMLGKKYRAQFLKNVPALGALTESVKRQAQRNGYLRLPDGRRAYIRSEHSALNTLLQGAGAVICKKWLVNCSRRLTTDFGPQGWKGLWAALAWIHDEQELATRPAITAPVSEILVSEMRALTDHFGWRVPLDGGLKVGKTWTDVH